MISAREGLDRLREGNRRFVSDTRRHDSLASEARRRELAAGQDAVRDHPRLLRFARAGRDRLRPGAGRSVRHPRRRQHRRAVAGGQRRVRGVALRHAPGRRPRPLAVRRDPRDARRAAAAAAITSRRTCDRSSTASGRRSRACLRPISGTIRDALVRQAVRANIRTSANHLRHGSDVLEQSHRH